MSNKEEVTINVGGIEVSGQITHRSEADISIRIDSPYQGLTRGLHIPYFSRPYNSFLTSYGESTARHLLKELYELSLYLHENRDFIILQSAVYFSGSNYSDQECQNIFFDNCFPFIVPVGTRDEVMEILR